jgi:hypothetical protein
VGISLAGPAGSSAATPADQFAFDPSPVGAWLGLNGNSSTYLGPIGYFLDRGVVYDRSGAVDFTAGETVRVGAALTPGGRALMRDLGEGMVPVVTVEYAGYTGNFGPDRHFPTEVGGSPTLREYVAGFTRTVRSILDAYPHRGILFEPMNEPWGYTTPVYNGREYAAVIAQLLPAAKAAQIPLSDIYVAATPTGAKPAGASGAQTWIGQMYEAAPALRTEIGGWYTHPYGPATREGGIGSLPALQSEMTSGQNNIIVSEIGYCAANVNNGESCPGGANQPDANTSGEAASGLTATLNTALGYRESGWLRALLVYSRNAGGWAMQLPHGRLTRSGRALEEFALRYGRSPARRHPGRPVYPVLMATIGFANGLLAACETLGAAAKGA